MAPKTQSLAITRSEDLVYVRKLTRELLNEYKFSLIEQTKMVTAASELARNIIDYADSGVVTFEILNNSVNGHVGLKIVFADQGPGITDVELAMKDGYTTGNGLGLGLGGAKRLVNEFDLQSTPGQGTKVTIIRWR